MLFASTHTKNLSMDKNSNLQFSRTRGRLKHYFHRLETEKGVGGRGEAKTEGVRWIRWAREAEETLFETRAQSAPRAQTSQPGASLQQRARRALTHVSSKWMISSTTSWPLLARGVSASSQIVLKRHSRPLLQPCLRD